jgi:integrase
MVGKDDRWLVVRPGGHSGGNHMKRHATNYPGVFYREVKRRGGAGIERVYYIVFKKDGKVHEEKAGRQYVDDMTPARAAGIRAQRIEGKRPSRKEIREAKRAEEKAKVSKWTLGRLWEAYKEAHPENKTLRADDWRFARNLKDTIGDKEPRELVPLDIDRIRMNLHKRGKHTTATRVLEILRRTINFGINRNLIPPVPFQINVPRLNNQVTEDLTPEEMRRLLKALAADKDILCANLMRLALVTGMRRGELFRLRWDDLDFERGFIHLRDPKGGQDQKIPLNEAARRIMESHPRTDSPYLFPGRKEGEHITEMRKSIDRIRKAAGLPEGFRPLHGLRHVYASSLASSGQVDLYTLQKLLTHKSPAMTTRYAHLRDEALRRAADLAGDLITAAMKMKEEGTGEQTA